MLKTRPLAIFPLLGTLAVLLLAVSGLCGQTYNIGVRKLSVEDGLSNRFAWDILRDQQGFVWVGTGFGLNRYDGYNFKHYTTENSNLLSNIVRRLGEDQEGLLWIKQPLDTDTQTDIVIHDPLTDSIRPFDEVFGERASFLGKDVLWMGSNEERAIWLILQDRRVICYRDQQFREHYRSEEAVSFLGHHPGESFFWVNEENEQHEIRVLKVSMTGEVLWEFPLENESFVFPSLAGGVVWLVYPRERQLVRMVEGRPPEVFDGAKLGLPDAFFTVTRSYRTRFNPWDGLLWWAHNFHQQGNFLVIDPSKGVVYNLYDDVEGMFTYQAPFVSDLYFEAEGRIWIATQDGIFVVSQKENRFQTLLADGPEVFSMRGIVTDAHGNCYANALARRFRISLEGGQATDLMGKLVWMGAYRDPDDKLWFGSYDGRLDWYDPVSEDLRKYYLPDRSSLAQSDRQIDAIVRDKQGRIWIGSGRGLYFLDRGENQIQKFDRYNQHPQLAESIVFFMQLHEEGIFLASSTGLYLLDPDKGIVLRYAPEEAPPRRLPFGYILHFYRDSEDIFWLATRGGGLIRFDPKTGNSEQFTTVDGFSSNVVYAVYEDEMGRMWLPSERGLMVFQKDSHAVNTFLKSDGVAHNEFNTLSHHRAEDGRLYFGGLAGITVVNPAEFKLEEAGSAPLRMTSVEVLDGKTGALIDRTSEVKSTNRLELSPSDRSLILEFALLNHENSQQNTYEYTIEGLDEYWHSSISNSLHINALPYGEYLLRIRGKDIKGTVSANELRVDIQVNKPFYLEWSFLAGAFVVLVLLVVALFRWRLKRLQQAKELLEQTVQERTHEIRTQKDRIESDRNTILLQAEKLKELDQAKSRFFANISHEFRTPLTLILGPLNQLVGKLHQREEVPAEEVREPLQVMERNGKRLLQLIEEILDLSKLEVGKLELVESPTVLHPFVKRLFSTFESHAESRGMPYELDYQADPELRVLLDGGKVDKVITNYLSNAFRYAPDGASVTLSVVVEGEVIRVAVTDRGPGIHPDDLPLVFDRFYQSKKEGAQVQGGTGVGLALCRELAALMGGEVGADSQLGEGSTFWVKFPLKQLEAAQPEESQPLDEHERVPDLPETQPASPVASLSTGQRALIWVVEDHADMQRYIVDILRGSYDVQTAQDGARALEMLNSAESLPDLILSDVMMPNMDGFTLLDKVKSHSEWRQIPMVLLTARAAQEDRLQALGTGVDDYLTKPFDVQELLARIRNLLGNYQERKRWQKREMTSEALNPPAGEAPESWDQEWLAQAREIVRRELENSKFKVTDLAAEMNISETQLLVKMKQITGYTPNEFIREIKLQKARVLLENKAKSTVAEVAYAAGFNTPGYFSKVYEKRFGKRPAAYLA